jgi:hypothetical protein
MTSVGTPLRRSVRPGWYGSGCPTRARAGPSVLASWTAPLARASHSRGRASDECCSGTRRFKRTRAPGILSLARLSIAFRISAGRKRAQPSARCKWISTCWIVTGFALTKACMSAGQPDGRLPDIPDMGATRITATVRAGEAFGSPGRVPTCQHLAGLARLLRPRRPMARPSDATVSDKIIWGPARGAFGRLVAAGRRPVARLCAACRRGLWADVGGLPTGLVGGCGRLAGGAGGVCGVGLWAACRRGLRGLAGRACGATRGGSRAVCQQGCGRLAGGVCKAFAKGFGKAGGKPREGLPEDCRKTAGPRDRGHWGPLLGTDRDHLHAIECQPG